MTVSSINTKNSYNGDGSTTSFAYTFPIHTTAELKVIERAANGTETVKSLTTHYAVVDNGSAGGQVNFGTAPASGVTVVLLRDTNLTQETDYVANDPFGAETHEAALDKLTLQIQEAQEELDRSIKLSRTNTITSTEFTIGSTDRAGKMLGFDNSGNLSVTQEIGSNRGNWSASTSYAVRDIVKDTSTNNIFMAKTAHTSSGSQPLTTNTDSAKWDLLVDTASATTSATNAASSATSAASSASTATTKASEASTSAASALSHKNDANTAKTAAETARTAAQTAQTAAEAALDTFDDRFLGAKSSDPSVDNDGAALVDGAIYFDTTNDVMKVYDLSNTVWRQLALTGTNQTNVNTVAGQISPTNNIATVAGLNSQITTVSGLNSEITTLAGISGLSSLAGASAAVTNVNNNLTAVQNFADVYRISSSAPSSSLNVGDLYFDTTANELKVYKSSGWAAAGSTVNGTSARFNYTATAGQTTFTGADTAGNTLAYDAGFADVYLNGVRLSAADITITSGTSVVLASGAAAGDILDVVAYGTFNVAAVNGSAINAGTINNARLPSTISQTNLVAAGDGSSADGYITLNCSQNSHGVKIQSPAHSAGQSYTLILPTSVGTANQVLATNGNSTNQLTWIDAAETKPTVANVSQTIAPATATSINITGTNFSNIPQVEFIKSDTGAITQANSISLTNATTLAVNVTLASGTYYVRVELDDGNAARSTNAIITASTAPSFSTAAGSLGSFAGNFSGTVATIAGSSDSAITFSEVGSNLSGANVTLNTSTGALTTTDFGGSSTTPTQYNFTIRITDQEGQTTDRAFSFTSSFGATGGAQFN
nr:tail fiber [uncultured Mediterranean phage uvMED]